MKKEDKKEILKGILAFYAYNHIYLHDAEVFNDLLSYLTAKLPEFKDKEND